jgi:hypothetical protein
MLDMWEDDLHKTLVRAAYLIIYTHTIDPALVIVQDIYGAIKKQRMYQHQVQRTSAR